MGQVRSDRENAKQICELTHHDWQEGYYGLECSQCGEFIPYGCEPWDTDQEEDPSRFCPHCGKEYEDFSDYGCEYCERNTKG